MVTFNDMFTYTIVIFTVISAIITFLSFVDKKKK